MKRDIFYIEKEQKRLASLVTKKFKEYYLTGGTALSFYFKHRFSEDLDFFSQNYKREQPDKIMDFIYEQTGFNFQLDSEQNRPRLVPMKVYFLELKKGRILKIDFVQDFAENINKIKNGLHSIEDIYYRKISAAIGTYGKQDSIGRKIPTGRQSAKDLFDIYYLSSKHKALSEFFFEYFSYDRIENLMFWYKSFSRTRLKMELLDLVAKINTTKVLKHLDNEILKKFPDKLI